jgi:hypothetical protein
MNTFVSEGAMPTPQLAETNGVDADYAGFIVTLFAFSGTDYDNYFARSLRMTDAHCRVSIQKT